MMKRIIELARSRPKTYKQLALQYLALGILFTGFAIVIGTIGITLVAIALKTPYLAIVLLILAIAWIDKTSTNY
jgi:hypothetical protein